MNVKKVLLVFVLSSVAAVSGCRHEETAAPARPAPEVVRVQFGWLFDSHHLGFLIAQQRGYYAVENLQVTLMPGSTETSVVKSLVTGSADIGQISGPEQLIAAAGEKLPVQAVAAFHRKSPHALISLDRNPIRTAADISGKRIAVAFGDAAEEHLRDVMREHGIRDSEVTLVPFRFDLTPLRVGQVDAITGFATDQPFTLEEQGLHPVVLPYYTLGNRDYGYMFVTSTSFAKGHSDAITRFLRASRRGWQDVFANPQQTLAEVAKQYPSWVMSVEEKKLAAVRTLMLDESGRLSTWRIDPALVRGAVNAGAAPIDNRFEEAAEAAKP